MATHFASGQELSVKETDMPEEMIEVSKQTVVHAFDKFSEDKDIAAYLKDTFERRYGPTWHCVVGRSFGSRVSYEMQNFILLKLNQHSVMLFRCGY